MIVEIFVSFLIFFAVWSLGIYGYRNYTTPVGLESTNVWSVHGVFETYSDSVAQKSWDVIGEQLKNYPEIESFAFGSPNFPYHNSSMSTDFDYKSKNVRSEVVNVEPDYPKVMGLNVIKGAWFTKQDTINPTYKLSIITQHLAEELFGKEEPIGKLLNEKESHPQKIIGVVANYKQSNDFEPPGNTMFFPLEDRKHCDLLLKVKPDVGAEFQTKLSKQLAHLGNNWNVEITRMQKKREEKDRAFWVSGLIVLIVCGFLILNVAFGLFGVLFQTIYRRRGEIGIRRAMGATQTQIMFQFVGEIVLIATLGAVVGLFFAIQFPLLHIFDVEAGVYVKAILLSLVSVYGLVILCAVFPSRQAAGVYPAGALHDE